MANTLPIVGANNLLLTSRLPIWDHRLRYVAGSLIAYDIDDSDISVDYRLFTNPIAVKNPTDDATITPLLDDDWYYVPITNTAKPTP